jgi:hypothetical protein
VTPTLWAMAISLDPHTWLVNLLVRLDGPGAFRFVFQPLVAMLLGVRDGRRDAVANRPPYLSRCVFDVAARRASLSDGFATIGKPFVIAIVIDALLSLVILGAIYPVSTLFVGVVLVALPYVIARDLTGRLVSSKWFHQHTPALPRI